MFRAVLWGVLEIKYKPSLRMRLSVRINVIEMRIESHLCMVFLFLGAHICNTCAPYAIPSLMLVSIASILEISPTSAQLRHKEITVGRIIATNEITFDIMPTTKDQHQCGI